MKVGRDHYGVFPLRGKLLNVREASTTQITNNKEIENIKKILGLKQHVKYENVNSLRYGQMMIMTDQVLHSLLTQCIIIFLHICVSLSIYVTLQYLSVHRITMVPTSRGS